MSTTTSVTIAQALANHLKKHPNPSTEETLYQNAVTKVLEKEEFQKLNQGSVHKLLRADCIGDLVDILELELLFSDSFFPGSGKLFERRLGKWSALVLDVKPLVDVLVAIANKIGTPIWGSICFILTLARGINDIHDCISSFQQTVAEGLRRWKGFFELGHALSDFIQEGLQVYYENIIELCLTITSVVARSRSRASWKSALPATKRSLTSLMDRLQRTTDNINARRDDETHRNVISPPTTSSSSAHLAAITIGLPNFRNPYFTGRNVDLQWIQLAFARASPTRPLQAVIYGVAGIGKSQLALQYAMSLRSNAAHTHDTATPSNPHIFYFRAHSHPDLLVQYRTVADLLGLIPSSMVGNFDQGKLIETVQYWFQRNPNWLLILDNVQDARVVRQFAPVTGRGCVLFTTRAKHLADDLADYGPLFTSSRELDLLEPAESAELLLRAMGEPSPWTTAMFERAQTVVAFACNLPIAIEQFAKNARVLNLDMETCLDDLKTTTAMLKQKPISSCHEENLSVYALLVQAQDEVRRKSPQAAAFFELLVCLDGSSIPLSMIRGGSRQMKLFFMRTEMYERGSRRGPEPLKVNKNSGSLLQNARVIPKSRIWKDMVNDGPRWWRKNKDTSTSKQTLRLDSDTDVQLQDYWKSNPALQEVCSDSIYTDSAVQRLTRAGLVRYDNQLDTIWIHDLFIELVTGAMAAAQSYTYANNACLASTMVYLAFPLPERRMDSKSNIHQCLRDLPHARTAHCHLIKSRTLNNIAIGPELSRLIAYTLQVVAQRRRAPDHEWRKVIDYYNFALQGYQAAEKRLYKSGMSKRRIRDLTAADFMAEEADFEHGYSLQRLYDGYEIFGSGPSWRALNMLRQLGLLMLDHNRYRDAEIFYGMAAQGMDHLFGRYHNETHETLMSLVMAQMGSKRWQTAHMTLVDIAWRFVGARASSKGTVYESPSRGLLSTKQGAEISGWMSRCCDQLGRGNEAITFRELALQAAEAIHGKDSIYNCGNLEQLAQLHDRYGNTEASLFYWTKLMDIRLSDASLCLGDDDPKNQEIDFNDPTVQRMIKDNGFSQYIQIREECDRSDRALTAEMVRETIAEFEKARVKAGVVNIKLERHVSSIESSAREWEMRRQKQEEKERALEAIANSAIELPLPLDSEHEEPHTRQTSPQIQNRIALAGSPSNIPTHSSMTLIPRTQPNHDIKGKGKQKEHISPILQPLENEIQTLLTQKKDAVKLQEMEYRMTCLKPRFDAESENVGEGSSASPLEAAARYASAMAVAEIDEYMVVMNILVQDYDRS